MVTDTIKKVANAILDAGEGCQSGLVYVDPVEAAKAAIEVLETDVEPSKAAHIGDIMLMVALARLKQSVADTEFEMSMDTVDAQTTGERPDLHDYEVSLTLGDAKAILAALSTDAEPVAYRVRMAGGVWQLRHVIHEFDKWDIVEPLYAALSKQVRDARSDDDEETYQIGIRDGYSQAVQEIDRLTGGDGEYRYCTDHDPERHTPGPAEMIQRIVDRFETLNLIGEAEKRGDFWDVPGPAQVQDVATPEVWQLVPKELTPEMRTRLQMHTEMGAYVCENLVGAYALMDEYHAALIDASPAASAPCNRRSVDEA